MPNLHSDFDQKIDKTNFKTAIISSRNQIEIINLNTNILVQTIQTQVEVTCLLFYDNDIKLITRMSDASIHVYRLDQFPKYLHTLLGQMRRISCMKMLNKHLLAPGLFGSTIKIWNVF